MEFRFSEYQQLYTRRKKYKSKKEKIKKPKLKNLKVVEDRRLVSPRGKIFKRYIVVIDPKVQLLVGGLTYYTNPKADSSIRYKHIKKRDASVDAVGMAPEFRNKGFGSKMLKRAEIIARKEKKNRMLLAVMGFNKKGIKLYERMGYKTIHKTTLHKGAHGSKEGEKNKPAFIMAKELK